MKPRLLVVLVLIAVAAGLFVDRWTSSSGRPAAFGDAQRIWWDHDHVSPGEAVEALPPGVAFSFGMVRDFALSEAQLEQGRQRARLVLLGDPDVLVHWNGVLVHSTHYRVGGAADVLDVSLLLRANNRVVFEVRSDHGAGGVMAALWLDDWSGDAASDLAAENPVWVTDADWRASRHIDPWLLEGWLPLDAPRVARHLRPVRVWPALDLGRWQPLRVADEVVRPTWPSARQARYLPERVAPFEPASFEPGSTPPWPPGWVLDFGDTVEGCLSLSGGFLRARRAHFAESPSTFAELHGPVEFAALNGLGPGHRESWVLPLPGAERWVDAVPRSFRAVLLEGHPNEAPPGPQDVWVQPCAASEAPARPDRLFGS